MGSSPSKSGMGGGGGGESIVGNGGGGLVVDELSKARLQTELVVRGRWNGGRCCWGGEQRGKTTREATSNARKECPIILKATTPGSWSG